jgi:translation initiation factor 2B subunit (eIF-2B alpha/beta/delta family)
VTPELERRIAALAADRHSGASTILVEVMALLRQTLSSDQPLMPVARALCRAQPSMAPVWNAALAACAADGSARLAQFVQRVDRAPKAIARFAMECFRDAPRLNVVTVSNSGSVMHALTAISHVSSLRVACSESRPALEGRRLAAQLAALEIPVTCYADAAIGHALDDGDAVIVGADAIAPEWFLNKVGTRMLAAAAAHRGLPVYVVASRDKFVSASLEERLVVREEAASEIWSEPPAGVTVRNSFFERTPLDLVTTVISDIGLLGAGMIPDVCAAQHDEAMLQALRALSIA